MAQSKNPKQTFHRVFVLKKTPLIFAFVLSAMITTDAMASRQIFSTSNSCANVFDLVPETKKPGLFGKISALWKKSSETPTSVPPKSQVPKLTTIRLSSQQPTQETSVRSHLKEVQQVVNQANNMLLTEFSPPEVVFASFDARIDLRESSIRLFELELSGKKGLSQREVVPVITHEYFHLILNRMIADFSPTIKKLLDQNQSENYAQRKTHRAREAGNRVFELQRQSTLAGYIVEQLSINKQWGPSAFTKKRIDNFIRPLLKELNRDDLFDKIDFTWENVDQMIAFLENFRVITLIQAHKAETLKSEDKENPTPKDLYTNEEKSEISKITTFYSTAIHELFADLGAILFTGDPFVLSSLLKNNQRSFARNWSMNEYTNEYYKEKKYTPHTFFSYHREILWRDYFSKVPKQEWPKMVRALAEAFAKEIVQNPENIYVEVRDSNGKVHARLVDFELAGKHLEEVIQNTLGQPR